MPNCEFHCAERFYVRALFSENVAQVFGGLVFFRQVGGSGLRSPSGGQLLFGSVTRR